MRLRGSRRVTVAVILIALGVIALGFWLGCGRRPSVPESSSAKEQKLPFDRESRGGGVSPTQLVAPSTTRLPEGKPIAIRLRAELSSASAKVGDSFDASTDAAMDDEGQTLVPRGAAVVGRVLAAKRSDGKENGYLRVALVSVQLRGKTVLVDTSSVFAKGGARDGGPARDVVFTPERRLTFHLTQGVDLP